MARTKAGLGSGARLADFLSASLMARVVPPQAVHEVLDAHQCNSRRIRAFPAVAGVYYVMALSLYPEASYEAVFSAVSQGLAWEAGAPQPAGVSKVAISLLRSRIGWQPLDELVARCCVPLADAAVHPGGFYKGLRLVAFDGSTFELADDPAIEQEFGRPGGRQGRSGYPQARCVVLAECATHAIFGANLAPTAAASGRCAGRCWSASARACCAWPTAASTASSTGSKRARPAHSCCGAAAPRASCRSSRCSPTAATSAPSAPPASVPTRPGPGRSPFG